MQVSEVMQALAAMGTEQTRKTFLRHGAPSAENALFGVLVGDLKTLVKKIKVDHPLALQLFATGNSDAQYLACLIDDPSQVTVAQLEEWVNAGQWHMITEHAVAALAAETPYGWQLGLEWIDSAQDKISAAGWTVLAGVLALTPNESLDMPAISALLARVSEQIQSAPNRTRYCMNNFVISVGTYLPQLSDDALRTAYQIGKVHVEMGQTACKVPSAPEYIQKVIGMGRQGKKRKQMRC